MKRTVTALIAAGALAVGLSAGPRDAVAEPRTFTLDPAHLHVGFLVEHIGFAKTLGVFTEVEGTVVFDEAAPALQSIDVTVQTESVHTGHDRRDGHLRSDDFLAADDHPEMTFTLTGAEQTGERTGVVTGDLTMRGETHPVSLDVVWNKSGRYPFGDEQYVVGVSARGELQRSQWGMTYAVDNGLVGDTVEIIIEAELIRQDD
ncbi:MAG: YceI family protein [Marivibrio sp.]|uniref:YceI family protein n=1 Tax=Marivibrio sp. TaxID=2039719 RepID=UPI0032EEEA52